MAHAADSHGTVLGSASSFVGESLEAGWFVGEADFGFDFIFSMTAGAGGAAFGERALSDKGFFIESCGVRMGLEPEYFVGTDIALRTLFGALGGVAHPTGGEPIPGVMVVCAIWFFGI